MQQIALSHDDLSRLLLARYQAELDEQFSHQDMVRKVLGYPKSDRSDPGGLNAQILQWQADLLATRLLGVPQNPLISKEDLNGFFNSLIVQQIDNTQAALSPDDQTELLNFVRETFTPLLDDLMDHMPVDSYEESWQWINQVVQVAAQYEITVPEVPTNQEASDEVIRRLYTMDEYLSRIHKRVNDWLNEDFFRKFMVDLAYGLVKDDEEVDEKTLRHQIEVEVEPQVQKILSTTRQVFEKSIHETVTRIYD